MENKDKIQDEFMEFWEKTDNVGLGKYSDAVTQWWFEKIESILKSKQEEIEGEMDEMKKTKTTGFLHVIWGEKLRSKIPAMSDTDVSYNKALDELKPIISNLLK